MYADLHEVWQRIHRLVARSGLCPAVYGHVYGHVCTLRGNPSTRYVTMCTEMCTDMFIDMCMVTAIHTDIDMCIHTYIDLDREIRTDMSIDICADAVVSTRVRHVYRDAQTIAHWHSHRHVDACADVHVA